MKENKFNFVNNPQIRIPTIDAGRLKNRNNMISFLEVDVTLLRDKIRNHNKKNIQRISFNAAILKIIGDCIAENNEVQASLINDKKMVVFKDVDISISIERELNNMYFPFPLIIRAIQNKTLLEIENEINEQVAKEIKDEKDLFDFNYKFINLFYKFPSGIRVFLMEKMLKNPIRAKKLIGTVGFATVSMAGRLSGWVLPVKNPYSLYIALGSINKKPLVENDEIVIRDVLNLTVIFDHNVIDGTPARNFVSKLIRSIEKALIEI